MKKKYLLLVFLLTIACDLNVGEDGEKKGIGGGCAIRIGGQ